MGGFSKMKKLKRLCFILFFAVMVASPNLVFNNVCAQSGYNSYSYSNKSTSSAADLLPAGDEIDTQELSSEDWKVVLDLNDDDTKAGDFSFIKEEKADNNIRWILYVGVGLIFASAVGIIFVIVYSIRVRAKKASKKNHRYKGRHKK